MAGTFRGFLQDIDMKSLGHTLWLMPTGQAYEKFSSLIQKLAKDCNIPIFQPHITLLGEIMDSEEDCTKKAQQLVVNQKPFMMDLKEIGYQDYFFRALFVYTQKSKPLLDLHNKAKEIFQMQIPPYMPHLSLLYGSFPQTIKDKIMQEIDRDQSNQFEISSIHLVKGGEIKDWQIIKEFPLINPTWRVD